MNKYLHLLLCFAAASALMGCLQKNIAPPSAADIANRPSMTPLGHLRASSRPAPVFGPAEEYAPSPLEEVGHQGIFGVFSPALK
jgi:hypothetical protein